MVVVETQSFPSIGIPFPNKISGPPFPSDYEGSLYISDVPDTPTSSADTKCGSPKQASLHLLSASPTASMRVIVPSFSSTTTAGSSFQPTAHNSVRRGDATFVYESLPIHLPPQEARMGTAQSRERRASVFQVFSRSHSGIKRAKLPSLHSTSSPTLPDSANPSADPFQSSRTLSKSNSGRNHEYVSAMSSGISARSEPLHSTSDASGTPGRHRRHSRAISQMSQRLRRRSNPVQLNLKPQSSFDNGGADLALSDLLSSRHLEVLDEDGVAVRFGDLWRDQRTCVIFIRHFWCPQSMDYTRSIVEKVDPDALRRTGVRFVLISNGSTAMIKSYKSIFKFPFQIYMDPSLAVYRALGMVASTIDDGPESLRGPYVEHGIAAGVVMVLRNATKGRVPIQKNGGDTKQLGGEFVLGPGPRCSFASRIRSARSHTPILDVLAAAEVHIRPDLDTVPNSQPGIHSDEDQWMEEREAELKRMRARKVLRRGFTGESRSSEDDGR